MNTQTTAVTQDEHTTWLEELRFWSNELNFYEKVLLQLIGFPRVEEHADELEKYEDRFKDMRDRLEDIGDHLNNTNADDFTREKVRATEKDFRQLKDDFYKFSDKIDK